MRMRKVEKFNWINSTWEECLPIDIKELDMFRLFEPDGEPVKTKSGTTTFIAKSDTIINGEGIEEVTVF